jgi:adenosylmethionine-8-amino-7-oxononanoate aminotransferase
MANIDILEREHLVENSATVGKYMLDRLTGLKEHPTVGDVRGLGICCAVELVKDKRTKESLASVQGAGQLVRSKMAELGMLGRVGRDFLLLTPPLTVTEAEVDEMVDIIDRSIGHMEKESALG